MKLSVSLFLLFFILQTSLSMKQVWILQYGKLPERITYVPGTTVNSTDSYVFSEIESDYCIIIYVAGTHLKPFRKVMAAGVATEIVKQCYVLANRGANIHLNRKTSDSVNIFSDVLGKRETVYEKIPRLYFVKNIIRQIPLKPEFVNNVMAYVLHHGSDVKVHYSSSTRNKDIEIAKLFAEYIRTFQREKYGVDTHISESYDQKKSKNALKQFVRRIQEIVKILHQNETNSSQRNDLGNSETLNEEFDSKINIAHDEEDENFEKLLERLVKYMHGNGSVGASDDSNFERIFNSRITSSSSTSSSSVSSTPTSTGSARQNVKRNTTRKGKKKSFTKSGLASATASTSKDLEIFEFSISKFVSESSLHIFGTSECLAMNMTFPVEFIKSTCVYVITSVENNEMFIYLGRDSDTDDNKLSVTLVELFLQFHPSANVSYIVDDGRPIPPFFMIYFKTELENLGISF